MTRRRKTEVDIRAEDLTTYQDLYITVMTDDEVEGKVLHIGGETFHLSNEAALDLGEALSDES